MGLFTPKNQSTYGGTQGPNKIIVFAIAGVVGIVLIILLMVVINWLSGTGKQDLTTTAARMANIQTLVTNANKKLRSGELTKLNSDSAAIITSNVVAINNDLAREYGIKKLDKETLAKETNAADTKALNEAELINKYDITYRQILRKNIANTLISVKAAARSNSARQTKTDLETTIATLNNLDKRLSELSLQ